MTKIIWQSVAECRIEDLLLFLLFPFEILSETDSTRVVQLTVSIEVIFRSIQVDKLYLSKVSFTVKFGVTRME